MIWLHKNSIRNFSSIPYFFFSRMQIKIAAIVGLYDV